jgi:hypothetical protein
MSLTLALFGGVFVLRWLICCILSGDSEGTKSIIQFVEYIICR